MAEVGSLSTNAKMATKFSSGAYVLSLQQICCLFARNCKFANLIQCNMQYIPFNDALLAAQKNTVVVPKRHFIAPSFPQSA